MKKPCRICKTLVEAKGWDAHQDAHKNEVRPDHWGSSGRVNRQQARNRDRNRCTVCGRTRAELKAMVDEDFPNGHSLHVHHINGDSKDHRLENLESRCDMCHDRGGVPLRYRDS